MNAASQVVGEWQSCEPSATQVGTAVEAPADAAPALAALGHLRTPARPELFFRALPGTVRGPGQPVTIRSDSTWDVPEPELTLVVDAAGEIAGLTIGNDMSSRSIEGENPWR